MLRRHPGGVYRQYERVLSVQERLFPRGSFALFTGWHDRHDRHVSRGDKDRHVSRGDKDRHVSRGDKDRHVSRGDKDRHVSRGDKDRHVSRGDKASVI